jgi:hypothetical protein
MNQTIDPKEFSCTDDAPTNNGWGHDLWPEPKEEEENIDEPNEDE